jgi:methionyl-tRNA formyltransferase
MKIAYFGYDFFFACMEELVSQGHEIYKVFTFPCDNKYNFNARVIALAEKVGAEMKTDRPTKGDIERLAQEGCELIVSAGYQYKIPVLSESMPYAINIHPTLLPEGRGPWPLPWIVLKGLKESGVTVHKLSERMDEGDILLQKKFDVTDRDDLETISCKSQMAAVDLIRKLMADFENHWKNARPQSGGSYWPMPTLEEQTIDWNKGVDNILRQSRAFGKFDVCTKFDGKEWVVQDVSAWKEDHAFEPGTVVHRASRETVIAAKDGFVCLRFFGLDPDFIA